MDENAPIISTYTRKQAIEDGVLIDVSAAASARGFKLHTVVTDSLYYQYVTPPEGLIGEGQTIESRLHDLLMMAFFAAKKNPRNSRAEFTVLFLMRPGHQEEVDVVLHVGPGDDREPVVTIMLPEED
jgi:hypothetical protein